MPVRPSRLWKDMPPEKRLIAADAFWREEQAERITRCRRPALWARRMAGTEAKPEALTGCGTVKERGLP